MPFVLLLFNVHSPPTYHAPPPLFFCTLPCAASQAGDRWQQSWDGLKAHDPQVWAPLGFNADGSIRPLRWLQNFSIDVI